MVNVVILVAGRNEQYVRQVVKGSKAHQNLIACGYKLVKEDRVPEEQWEAYVNALKSEGVE